MAKCNHIQTPVDIGTKTVYITGSQYIDTFEPLGRGVFLDQSSWGRKLSGDQVAQAYIYDWPDFGVVPIEDFKGLILRVGQELIQGGPVEVGCIGAHGRTGTLLAGMLIAVEGYNAQDAILEIRERYCRKAVETESQMDLLNDLASSGYRLMLEAPPRPGIFRRIFQFLRIGGR